MLCILDSALIVGSCFLFTERKSHFVTGLQLGDISSLGILLYLANGYKDFDVRLKRLRRCLMSSKKGSSWMLGVEKPYFDLRRRDSPATI